MSETKQPTLTAEEFIREKIRQDQNIEGEMYGLGQYLVNGTKCLRWAKEFSDLSHHPSDAELPSDRDISETACDAMQQDWNDLRFKEIYRVAFIDGANHFRYKATLSLSKLKQENENLKAQLVHTDNSSVIDSLQKQIEKMKVEQEKEMEGFDKWKFENNWECSMKRNGMYVRIDEYKSFSGLLQLFRSQTNK